MDSVKRASTLAQAFAGFLPTPLLRRVLKNNLPQPGETEITQAVCLYADFSGVTAITSIIETAGDTAIEALNILLTAITEPIFAHGGVIAAFDGDAIIAYFPYPEQATLKAAMCAAQMRAALDRTAPDLKPYEFSLRIGLGVGTLTLITIGEVNQWLEFCITGVSLNRAISAAHWVNRNAVIAHSSVVHILGDKLPVETEHDENFYTVRTDLLLTEDTQPIGYTPLETEIPPELDRVLKQVLPDVIARQVERSYAYAFAERRLIETRDAITMYMAFVGADYSSLDAGAKLHEYLMQMARIVHRFDGHVFQVMLDDRGGLLRVSFPAETNISQALNCALAFQNTPFAREKEQRISITQGTLFVGSIGSSYWRAYVALGGGVGIARRLCERAQPGQIVVDGEIEHLTESDFRFATLPALMIKGRATPIRSYLLEGLHTIDNDLAAEYLRRKHTLIGRGAPLAQLIGKVEAAWAGQGSSIEIIGAAGVGKSRLIEEVVSDWSIRGGSGYLATSPIFGRNAPYLAWAQLWTTIFGLRVTDSADARRDRVTRFLADLNPTFSIKLNMVVTLFWKVLGLIDQTSELVQDTRSLQHLFAEISLTVLKAMAAKNPLLLVFDNSQWADSGTVMALNYLAAHLSGLPILLITEHRPTVEPLDLHSDLRIELPGLTHDEGVQFVKQIVGDIGFSDSLHSKLGLVEGRPCNPLQIEQALALMVGAGVLQPAATGTTGYRYNPADRFTLPNSFSDVIAARIEQLDAATRTIIQTAAALGTEFSFPILRMLNEATFTDEVLEALLDKLNKADLTLALNHHARMQRRDRFSHPLIQETIYENLPSSRRRTLHLAIAEELARHREGKYPSQVGYADANDPLIAFHFDQAEQFAETARYSIRAGIRAQSLGANREARHHFAIAERNLNRFRGEEAIFLRIDLALYRGMLYANMGRYDEALTEFHESLTTARTRSDSGVLGRIYNQIVQVYLARGETAQALSNVEKAINSAEKTNSHAALAEAFYLQGEAYRQRRDYSTALSLLIRAQKIARDVFATELSANIANSIGLIHFEQFDFETAHQDCSGAVAAYRLVGDRRGLARALGDQAITEYYLGNGETAHTLIVEAIQCARDLDDIKQHGLLLLRAGIIASYTGRYKMALGYFDEAKAIFLEKQDEIGTAMYQNALAREYIRDHNEPGKVIEIIEAVLPMLRERATRYTVLESMLALADSYIRRHDLRRGSDLLQQIDALIAEGKHYWYRPEAFLLKTQLAIAEGNYKQAYKQACSGLGAVGDLGDVRMLAPLYRMLALMLEREREQIEDARDALDRAIIAGRGRARRIDLALALRQAGLHFKRFANRPTMKARGSGYLFEADRMVDEMGVPIPRDTQPGLATQEFKIEGTGLFKGTGEH